MNEIDVNNSIEENKQDDNCPVHETPLIEGKCFQCGICYSCEGKM